MPAILGLILQGVMAAIQAAPKVIEIANAGKALITSLVGAGVITKEQQDASHAYVDAHYNLVAQGILIPNAGWSVEADPGK